MALRGDPRLREPPEAAAPFFSVYSGMDLDYWQEFYLLGEAEELVERIRARIEALGGMDWVVLNPLSFDIGQLERLASEVLPRLSG